MNQQPNIGGYTIDTDTTIVQQGWQCPLCKTVYSPFVRQCDRSHNGGSSQIYFGGPYYPNQIKLAYYGSTSGSVTTTNRETID